jgi:hypothetical protein
MLIYTLTSMLVLEVGAVLSWLPNMSGMACALYPVLFLPVFLTPVFTLLMFQTRPDSLVPAETRQSGSSQRWVQI